MNRILLIAFLVLFVKPAFSGDIKVYFNNQVDTTVSSGQNAIFLSDAIDDTLVAYIGRAQHTIDVAVYNFNQSSGIADIAGAINTAYTNGVRVRWIYDGSSSNNGLTNLNAGIPKQGSPTTSDYGIMHNKFMVIDAGSDSDAVVWTGSTNWNSGQINNDVNNVVVIQDKTLAQAFTTEFNEMWGDTGSVPDPVHAKFGPDKTDNTQHLFTIDGKSIECYFSPSDHTNNHILDAINSSDEEFLFGVYTFTLDQDADAILDRINHGVYVAGIIDEFSESYDPYSTLHPTMNNMLRVYYNGGTIYHNKMAIVDPCDPTSDPQVITGSHNWTYSADSKNDENTLIIHDDTIANIFYQSFRQNFDDLGGTIADCATIGIAERGASNFGEIYLTTNREQIVIHYNFSKPMKVSMSIFDVTGRKVIARGGNLISEGISEEVLNIPGNGVFVLMFESEGETWNLKLLK